MVHDGRVVAEAYADGIGCTTCHSFSKFKGTDKPNGKPAYGIAGVVALALVIGIALWWLSRRGRVLWLQVWSIGLVVFSIAYLAAAATGNV